MQRHLILIPVIWIFQLLTLAAEESFFINQGASIVSEKDTWWVIDGQNPVLYHVEGHATATFYNLRVADAAFHLASGAAVSIPGTLQNDQGVTGLILHSDESSTASLIHHNDNVNATIYRYIPAVYDWNATPATDWHMISAPVSGQEISGFIPDPSEGDYDFYGWSETYSTWINYKNNDTFGDFNAGFFFNKGQGYLLAYEQDQLFSFAGVMNAGDVKSNNLTYTGPEAYAGWHLLGNPFASSLDWNDPHWQRPEVLDEVHVWDRHRGNYISNNNGIGDFSGLLQPHQAMFIKVNNNNSKNAMLEFPAAARTHNAEQENSKLLPANSLRFEVQAVDTPFRDAVFVLLREDGSFNYDERYDAHKINGMGHAPELFSKKEVRNLSIHSLPYVNDQTELPLWFTPGSFDQFFIRVTGLDTVDEAINVLLLDLETGVLTDLRDTRELEFSHENGFAEARFMLILNPVTTNFTKPPLKDIEVYACKEYIYVKVPEHHLPARLIVTATDGRQWLIEDIAAKGIHQYRKPPVSGLLIVQVSSKLGSKTKKIINL